MLRSGNDNLALEDGDHLDKQCDASRFSFEQLVNWTDSSPAEKSCILINYQFWYEAL